MMPRQVGEHAISVTLPSGIERVRDPWEGSVILQPSMARGSARGQFPVSHSNCAPPRSFADFCCAELLPCPQAQGKEQALKARAVEAENAALLSTLDNFDSFMLGTQERHLHIINTGRCTLQAPPFCPLPTPSPHVPLSRSLLSIALSHPTHTPPSGPFLL
jgi:hypothetical protein